jgi:NADH-quinone oxidoreductase subunit M
MLPTPTTPRHDMPPDTFQIPWISLTVFTPLLGALALAFVPGEHERAHRAIAVFFLALTAIFAIALPLNFNVALGSAIQLTTPLEYREWIPAIGAHYHVGVDGVSLWMVMLTAFLGPIIPLIVQPSENQRSREMYVGLLVLQTGILGTFVALDVLLFYVFWELLLIPPFLLIGGWGGPHRTRAAVKMFAYGMFGSLLMLLAFIHVNVAGGAPSWSIEVMSIAGRHLSFETQLLVFGAVAFAFLIKAPVFPFHTWMPDAYVQSPMGVTLQLALMKVGGYALYRFAFPVAPDGALYLAPYIALLAVIGIAYAALIAWVQTGMKSLVAWSSVSHGGFVVLGIASLTAEGMAGAMYQNLVNGATAFALFVAVWILQRRRNTDSLDAFGGVAKEMPVFGAVFVFFALASAAVPGLAGFPGEFLVLAGTATSHHLTFTDGIYLATAEHGPELQAVLFAAVGGTGVIFGAVYLLHLVQKVLFGPAPSGEGVTPLRRLDALEVGILIPLVALLLFLGLGAGTVMRTMGPTAADAQFNIKASAQAWRAEVYEAEERATDFVRWQLRTGGAGPWQWIEQAREAQATPPTPAPAEPDPE